MGLLAQPPGAPSVSRDLGTGQPVRGWPAPDPARCPPSKVMAAIDTVLYQGQASRRSRLQNRTRAPSARLSHAPGAFTHSQANLGVLPQGPPASTPAQHSHQQGGRGCQKGRRSRMPASCSQGQEERGFITVSCVLQGFH